MYWNVCGSSIDDRAGCAVILSAAKSLNKSKNRPTVHIVFSVQEEFNLRGILPVVNTLKPHIAVQVDLMLSSDTPDMINSSDVHLGKGPCISLFSFHGRGTLNGVIPHPAIVELFEKVAKNKNINLQRSVASGILTDASYVQFANEGIATIDVGLVDAMPWIPISYFLICPGSGMAHFGGNGSNLAKTHLCLPFA